MRKIDLLIVASGNHSKISPFIEEQISSLMKLNLNIHIFLVRGKGIWGYFRNIFLLNDFIRKRKIQIIHAHYGYSGLLSIFQILVPVIITFHGCDVNNNKERIISKIAASFAKQIIFVEKKMVEKMNYTNKNNYNIIPCGINLSVFYPEEKNIIRKKLNWDTNFIHAVFASSFDIPVKNAELALMIIRKLKLPIILHELKNLSREEVRNYLNAGDFLFLTSIREGSPMVIKEALACNCPIVATNVGDISERISKIQGCFITSFEPNDIKQKIIQVIEFVKKNSRINGRNKIIKDGLTNDIIARKIFKIYQEVLG